MEISNSANVGGLDFIAKNISRIGGENQNEVDKVAKDFERMALAQLLAYTNTDNDMSDSVFGGGAGERAFQPFLMDEYAKGFAEVGGIGLANAVRGEILKLQEMAQSQ